MRAYVIKGVVDNINFESVKIQCIWYSQHSTFSAFDTVGIKGVFDNVTSEQIKSLWTVKEHYLLWTITRLESFNTKRFSFIKKLPFFVFLFPPYNATFFYPEKVFYFLN